LLKRILFLPLIHFHITQGTHNDKHKLKIRRYFQIEY
jgi:hypothetical protein